MSSQSFERIFTPHHMSHITCDVSHVTCHMSRDTYHMSHVSQGVVPDMENVVFFTPSQFEGKNFDPKNCVILGKTELATNQQNKKIQ